MNSSRVSSKTHYDPHLTSFSKIPYEQNLNFLATNYKSNDSKDPVLKYLTNGNQVNNYNFLRKSRFSFPSKDRKKLEILSHGQNFVLENNSSPNNHAIYNDTNQILKRSTTFYESANKTTFSHHDHSLEIDYPSKNTIHIPG